MCVSVYVCVYVCMCMHASLYVCINVCEWVCWYVYVCKYVYVCICMYLWERVSIYIYIYMCVCVCIYKCVCVYMNIYVYGCELYSDASPNSLVEHFVTFRHDRRLLSLLRFVHNWPTSRWSAKKKKKKKKRTPVFIKRKWNHVVFSRVTILSFHPVYGYFKQQTVEVVHEKTCMCRRETTR